jgi:flavin reductase (DIM6/NTAB) family NADH-FMN oxidoreductase RutF
MRQLATGVVIISAIDRGRRSGLTATAACSLTTAPPSVLVCVNRSSQTHDYIANSGRFCMNALAEQHRDVANVFAGATRLEGEAKFAHGTWISSDDRPPRLADALVSVECEIVQRVEAGTHTIFIGRVLETKSAFELRPLIYADRKFLRLSE